MTDNADKLLPCPFCGGEASDAGYVFYRKPSTETAWEDGLPITEAFFCNCPTCGISNMASNMGYRTKAQAIAAWNRRALDAAQAQVRAAALTELAQADAPLIWREAGAGEASVYDRTGLPPVALDAATGEPGEYAELGCYSPDWNRELMVQDDHGWWTPYGPAAAALTASEAARKRAAEERDILQENRDGAVAKWAAAEARVAELEAALRKIEARPDAMVWGEDNEAREAMREMEQIARATLAASQQAQPVGKE